MLAMAGTIRSQILLAFLTMTAITGIIGLHASYRIEHGGALVTETYDGSLMAINYAPRSLRRLRPDAGRRRALRPGPG